MVQHREHEDNFRLVAEICGERSLEAILSRFKLADLHSKLGQHHKVRLSLSKIGEVDSRRRLIQNTFKALELVKQTCSWLRAMEECPAEIVIGYYWLLGFLYQRMGDTRRAISAFETSLDRMEKVYGLFIYNTLLPSFLKVLLHGISI